MFIKLPNENKYFRLSFDTESMKDGTIYSITLTMNYHKKDNISGFIVNEKNYTHLFPYIKFSEQHPHKFTYVIDKKLNLIRFIFIDIYTFGEFLDTSCHNLIIYSENGARGDNHQLIASLQELHGDHQVLSRMNELEDSMKGFGTFHIEETLKKFTTPGYQEMLTKRFNRYFKDKPTKNKGSYTNPKWEIAQVIDDVSPHKGNHLYQNEWFIDMLSTTAIKRIMYKNKQNHNIVFKDLKLLFDTHGLALKGETVTNMLHLSCGDNHSTCMHKLTNENNYNVSTMYQSIKQLKADGNEFVYLLRDGDILHLFLNIMLRDKDLPSKTGKDTTAATAFDVGMYEFADPLIDDLEKHNYIRKTEDGKQYYMKQKEYLQTLLPNYYKQTIRNRRAIANYILKRFFPTTGLNDVVDKEIITTQATKKFTKDTIKGEATNTHWAYQYENLYYGGMVQINPRYKYDICTVTKIDVNSLYPSVMQLKTHVMSPFKDQEILAPYGKGITKKELDSLEPKEQKRYKYFYKDLIFGQDVYSSGNIPFVVKKGAMNKNEWKTTLKKSKVYQVDNYSLHAILKFYKNKKGKTPPYVLHDYLYFKTKAIYDIFGKYVEKFGAKKVIAKQNHDEGSKGVAKLLLNALYGKGCQKPMRPTKVLLDNEWVQYETYGLVNKYLPLGSLITNLARLFMVYFMDCDWDMYGVYMDTDSLAIREEWLQLEGKQAYLDANLDKAAFGKFEKEHEHTYFLTVESKRYCLYDPQSKKWEVTCSGLHQDNHDSGEDFISFLYGFTNIQKQKTLNINNSLRLDEVSKEFIPTYAYNAEENNDIRNKLIIKAAKFMGQHHIPRNKKYTKN